MKYFKRYASVYQGEVHRGSFINSTNPGDVWPGWELNIGRWEI